MKYKVGDKVKVIKERYNIKAGKALYKGQEGTVEHFYGSTGVGITKNGETHDWYFDESDLELVSQPSRRVVGYKLLKDLPCTDPKTIGKVSGTMVDFGGGTGYGHHHCYNLPYVEMHPEWFEPLYEEEKVVVELSNGKVEIEEGNVKFITPSREYYNVKPHYLKELKTKLSPSSFLGYQLQVLTFQVGCQTFTMEDLENVLAAIPTKD